VLDINGSMLEVGAERAEEAAIADNLDFVEANAEELPFEDASFDAYTIAFGIRNVPDIDKALREAYRVLRRGGRFLCLEFSEVEMPILDRVYDAWSFNGIPAVGKAIAGEAEPYQYLVESIRKFPRQADFARMIERAGSPGSATPITPAASRRFIRPGRSDRHGKSRYLSAPDACGLHPCARGRGFVAARRRASGAGQVWPSGCRPAGPAQGQNCRTHDRLARAVERLGPSWVKLGQFLATRPDVVGAEIADDLSGLQDRMATFRWRKRLPAPKSKLRSAGRSTSFIRASIRRLPRPPSPRSIPPKSATVTAPARLPSRWSVPACASVSGAISRRSTWSPNCRSASSVLAPAPPGGDHQDARADHPHRDGSEARGRRAFRDWATTPKTIPASGCLKVDWERTGRDVLTMEWVDGIKMSDVDASEAQQVTTLISSPTR
jgi:hypothetical protein